MTSNEEVLQIGFLLAWNDHCVQKSQGRAQFRSTNVDEFRKRWNKKPSQKWIDNKLRSIYGKFRLDASNSRGEIYNIGTRCLDMILLKLKEPQLLEAYEKATAEISLAENESNHSHLPVQPEVEVPPIMAFSQLPHPSPSQQLRLQTPYPDSSLSHNLSTDMMENMGDGEVNDVPEKLVELSVMSDSALAFLQQTLEFTASDETRQHRNFKNISDPVLESIISPLKRKISELNEENLKLHEELWQVKDERRKDSQVWRLTFNQLKAGDVGEELKNQQKFATQIQTRMEQATELNRFVNTSAYDHYAPSQEVEITFQSISDQSAAVFAREEDAIVRMVAKRSESSTLEPLMDALLSIRSGIDGQSGRNLPCHEPTRHIFRSIMALAIQNWIFESNWPNFYPEDSLQFHDCMGIIASGQDDGIKAIQALVGVMNYRRLKRPSFLQHVIPAKAEELTEDLIRVLSELVVHYMPKWQASTMLQSIRGRMEELKGLLKSCLLLKSKMLMSEHLYALFWVKSGSNFDEDTMVIRPEDESPSEAAGAKTWKVKLCLFPGLRVRCSRLQLANEIIHPDLEWSRVLLRYRMVDDDAGTKVLSAEDIVSKAVVLVE